MLRKCLAYSLTAMFVLPSGPAFGFGIGANGLLSTYGQPVHEMITQRAALETGLVVKRNSKQMQYLLEGIRFNDDPEGYLLKNGSRPAHGLVVLGFVSEFLGGGDKSLAENDPTKATHFGNFQYLHAMGTADKSAAQIKKSILVFAAHCWKMATEPNSFEEFKRDYGVVADYLKAPSADVELSEDQRIAAPSVRLFPKQVLFFHAADQEQFRLRALGSLLHIIQDSYAKGHAVRGGWEQGDNSGNIQYFQNYSEQDSHGHKEFDTHPSGRVNSKNFVDIPGSSMAFERSKALMTMVNNQCPWKSEQLVAGSACTQSVYDFLNNDVFSLDANSQGENVGTHSHPQLLSKKRRK